MIFKRDYCLQLLLSSSSTFLPFFCHLVIELSRPFLNTFIHKRKITFPFVFLRRVHPSPIPLLTCSHSHSVYFRVPHSLLRYVVLSFSLAFYFYILRSHRTDISININSRCAIPVSRFSCFPLCSFARYSLCEMVAFPLCICYYYFFFFSVNKRTLSTTLNDPARFEEQRNNILLREQDKRMKFNSVARGVLVPVVPVVEFRAVKKEMQLFRGRVMEHLHLNSPVSFSDDPRELIKRLIVFGTG